MQDRGRSFVVPVLTAAVLAVSAAPIFGRMLLGVHPVAIAIWRTAAVFVLLAPAVRPMAPRDLVLTGVAGLFLGLHFWTWFASLHDTSVVQATVLVCLTPLWVGLMEAVWPGVWPPRRFWAGIAVALAGVVGMVSGPGLGGGTWRGDALALLGGVLCAVYFLVGRSVRQRVGFAAYGSLVSGAAALSLLPVALALRVPMTGYRAGEWGVLALMVLGPQLLGHVGFNYGMRYVAASRVAALTLLEPVGAAILATFLLNEWPTQAEAIGGVVVLLGVGVATIQPRSG